MTSTSRSIKLCVPLVAFLLLLHTCQIQAAAINCGDDAEAGRDVEPANGTVSEPPKHGAATEVINILHTVQCTLEKAKPWVERLETEAKKLEEGVRVVGVQMFSRFSDIMDTLLGRTPTLFATRPSSSSSSSSTSTSTTVTTVPSSSALPNLPLDDGPVTVAIVLETTDNVSSNPEQHNVKIEALPKASTTEGTPPAIFVPEDSAENDLINEIDLTADEKLS